MFGWLKRRKLFRGYFGAEFEHKFVQYLDRFKKAKTSNETATILDEFLEFLEKNGWRPLGIVRVSDRPPTLEEVVGMVVEEARMASHVKSLRME